MMSRKNYVELAEIIADAKSKYGVSDPRAFEAIIQIQDKMVSYLKRDNSNFNVSLFNEACNPKMGN